MRSNLEEYIFYYEEDHILMGFIYDLLVFFKLIKNLNTTKIKEKVKILNSFNSLLIVNFFIFNNNKTVFLKIKLNNTKFIKKIRKILFKKIPKIKIIYSDFIINKSIDFFIKFIKYENMLRRKIIKTMYLKHQKDWWSNKINKKVSEISIKRSMYDNNKFDYIFYSDFLDIKSIVKDNWNDLSFIFKNNKKSINKMDIINKKRNMIFHGRFDFI